MTFDDAIIPDHNKVSSEWEKNERIRNAYDSARAEILPRWIDLLEKHVGDGVWVASTDLFHNNTHHNSSELWTKPDYLLVHGASTSSANDDPSNNNNNATSIHGSATTTQLFLERQHVERTNNGSVRNSSVANNTKIRKGGLPDKCLLRHEFSTGCHWFMVCKLRRRHQKEIAKHPSTRSSSSSHHHQSSSSSSAVLEGLARSAVLKHYKPSKTSRRPSSEGQSKDGKDERKESGTEAIETSAKDATGETRNSDDGAVTDPKGDPHQHHYRHRVFAKEQHSMLQEETNVIVMDALSIVRAAKNLEVGEVPKTTMVRWKAEDEFEIHYFN